MRLADNSLSSSSAGALAHTHACLLVSITSVSWSNVHATSGATTWASRLLALAAAQRVWTCSCSCSPMMCHDLLVLSQVRRRGRRGFWHWLLRDKRQPFEIVMLDHGTYFTADTVMRQQLCQLWCSFVLGDKQLQVCVGWVRVCVSGRECGCGRGCISERKGSGGHMCI
eukprot:1151749-Pelagomonas_calceolata.AAC.3